MPRIYAKDNVTTAKPDMITATDVGTKRALDVNIADGDVTVNASDIELGAVELKDATTGTRAVIGANGLNVVVGNTTPIDVNIESIENNYQDVIFHNAADANATGETIDVDGYTELLISITGTDVTTSTITFKAVDADTNATNIGLAVRLSDGVIASSTSTVAATPGEKWIIPVRGVTQVQMPLTNLTGSGATVTVKGRLT